MRRLCGKELCSRGGRKKGSGTSQCFRLPWGLFLAYSKLPPQLCKTVVRPCPYGCNFQPDFPPCLVLFACLWFPHLIHLPHTLLAKQPLAASLVFPQGSLWASGSRQVPRTPHH